MVVLQFYGSTTVLCKYNSTMIVLYSAMEVLQ